MKENGDEKPKSKADILTQIHDINDRLDEIGDNYEELNKEMDEITET